MVTHPLEGIMIPDDQDEEHLWLTPDEAAGLLKVSRWSIIRECERHHLPAIKVAGKWRISFLGLQRMAEKNVIEEPADSGQDPSDIPEQLE